jgi:hypothetical protein
MNFDIKTMDKASGFINTEEVVTSTGISPFRSAHRYADRGWQFSERERATVRLFIKAAGPAKTDVRVRTNIEQSNAGNIYNSESNGLLEKQILNAVEDSLGVRPSH